MDSTPYYAVIVAGGSGVRMQTATPKQFLLIKGLPIIMHTILKFANNKYKPKIIVVLAHEHITLWQNLVIQHSFTTPYTLVYGGTQRFYSVQNSLLSIANNAIVAIHDAVRPCVSDGLISKCYASITPNGNAVCAIAPHDSVRVITQNGQNKMLPRSTVFLVQTPQVFHLHQLKKAYSVIYNSNFTDDASVIEHAGYPITLIQGEIHNIKITLPLDIKIASEWL
jgi:2-C-methyl-D-erythritol 4-phosphate cytidylyltransferase